MKNRLLFFSIVFLFLILIIGENRATSCGMGLFNKILLNGFVINWFNGSPRLETEEGLGVVYSGMVMKASKIEINRLLKYKLDQGGILLVANTIEDKMQKIVVTEPLFEPRLLKSENGFNTIDGWLSIRPIDCFWGRWDFLRGLIVLIILVISLSIRKTRLKN